MGIEQDPRELSRNDVIRKALAAEVPEQVGPLVVTRSIEVEDAQGNMRQVDFIGSEPTTPEE